MRVSGSDASDMSAPSDYPFAPSDPSALLVLISLAIKIHAKF